MGEQRASESGPGQGEPYAAVHETHTAVVFLLGDRAFKLKKPVRYGFLDFTDPHERERLCHREVELNRRLAPDVYLGVAEVRVPDHDWAEHLVTMRRLPAARALSTLVQHTGGAGECLEQVANVLADFHRRAVRSPDCERSASAETVLARWLANGTEMAPLVGTVFPEADHRRVIELAARFVGGRAPLFGARIAAGRACDGHGDLLADDVYCLDDGPRILDCLEFDDQLRSGDALGDVCSLAMDLERLGSPQLAFSFVDAYQHASGDRWPPSLEHHYVAYRAQVRALVAGLRFQQGRPEAADAGRDLLALSRRHLEAGRIRLVVVGGLPGAGKSTVARWVAERLGATVARSDEVRKRLAGVGPEVHVAEPFEGGLYGPAMSEATYRAMFDLARSELGMGRSTVLDATFEDPRWRAMARALASETKADLTEVRCEAPLEVLERRLLARAAHGRDLSDATPEVARRLAFSQVPWPEATALRTDGTPEEVRTQTLALLEEASSA